MNIFTCYATTHASNCTNSCSNKLKTSFEQQFSIEVARSTPVNPSSPFACSRNLHHALLPVISKDLGFGNIHTHHLIGNANLHGHCHLFNSHFFHIHVHTSHFHFHTSHHHHHHHRRLRCGRVNSEYRNPRSDWGERVKMRS